MPVFERDDIKIVYTVKGNGAPVLLLHGFMGTGTTEFPALLAWLEKHFTVIAPDLRGYGQSSPKPRQYGRDFYLHDAEDMAALLNHLDLPPAIVIGYSDGGEVALWLPILAPKRVNRVVTWGAIGHFDPVMRSAVLSMLNMRWRTPQIDQLHGAEYISEMAHRWVVSLTQIIESGGDITYSRAKEINCPVLLILGNKDPLNPVEMGRTMAEALPQGKFSLYKNTGHAVHTEQPERFYRELGDFLEVPANKKQRWLFRRR